MSGGITLSYEKTVRVLAQAELRRCRSDSLSIAQSKRLARRIAENKLKPALSDAAREQLEAR